MFECLKDVEILKIIRALGVGCISSLDAASLLSSGSNKVKSRSLKSSTCRHWPAATTDTCYWNYCRRVDISNELLECLSFSQCLDYIVYCMCPMNETLKNEIKF